MEIASIGDIILANDGEYTVFGRSFTFETRPIYLIKCENGGLVNKDVVNSWLEAGTDIDYTNIHLGDRANWVSSTNILVKVPTLERVVQQIKKEIYE